MIPLFHHLTCIASLVGEFQICHLYYCDSLFIQKNKSKFLIEAIVGGCVKINCVQKLNALKIDA
jgi:hypothetical protein